MKKITPLQYNQFFSGKWKGEGSLVPNPIIRWFVPEEQVRFESETKWLSDSKWVLNELFEFSSGRSLRRTVSAEVTAPDRLHLTSHDLPQGANVTLKENGFIFDPYEIFASYRGFTIKLRCRDENIVNERGIVHDTVTMYFAGMYVARMILTVQRIIDGGTSSKKLKVQKKKQSKRK